MNESPAGRFLDYLRFEKRFSPHTVTAYATDLEQFSAYLNAVYSITDILSVDHTIVRSWAASLLDNGITARSVNRKLSTLKAFYRFALKNSLVKASPMLKVQSPKTDKRLPVFVQEEKINSLLNNPSVEGAQIFSDSFADVRARLILELLYGCGIRLSELINLLQKNINFDRKQIKVLGKRNKERIIPINASLEQIILRYLELRNIEFEGNAEEVLLISDKGKKLYEKFVYSLVTRYLSEAGVSGKRSPHVLRHTFATHMLNRGADIVDIKDLLGHSSLSATQVYTHNTIEKLKKIHQQAHPKA